MLSVASIPLHEPKSSASLHIIHAELIRTKHSTLEWFPLIGAFIGVVSSTLAFVSSGAQDASGALGWQAMYVTCMAAPLLALIAGLAEDREKSNHNGGTNLRPVSAYATRLARLSVLTGISALFHLMNFGIAWIIVASTGRDGASSLLYAGFYSFIGSISTIAFFSLVARYLPLIASLIVAFIYQVIGTLMAESSVWLWIPPTWPVRLLLPVLRVHSNAVPLQEGESLAHESIVPTLSMCLFFAVVTFLLATLVEGPQRSIRFRESRKSQIQTSELVLPAIPAREVSKFQNIGVFAPRDSAKKLSTVCSALGVAILHSSITYLVLAVSAIFISAAVIYPASYISGAYTFFVLPLGAGILPVLTWKILSPSWQLTVVETPKVRNAYLVWHMFLLMFLALIVGVCYLFAGGEIITGFRLILMWVTTGMVLSTIGTAFCISYSSGLSIAWAIFVTVLSLTLGGDVLAQTPLWILALPSWPEIADTPGRLLLTVAIEIVLIVLSTRWSLSAIKNFERTS